MTKIKPPRRIKSSPQPKGILRRTNTTITTIDADTWAESGGTAGMFGHLHAQGRLRIVPTPLED